MKKRSEKVNWKALAREAAEENMALFEALKNAQKTARFLRDELMNARAKAQSLTAVVHPMSPDEIKEMLQAREEHLAARLYPNS